jgi:hypothetical protein
MTKSKKDKRTNNDLQNTTEKTKAPPPPIKNRGELMYSWKVINSCYTSNSRRITLLFRL